MQRDNKPSLELSAPPSFRNTLPTSV
jgi:hypothetical protein